MRIHPLSIKPWVAGIAAGLPFGVIFTVLTLISVRNGRNLWPVALIGGLAGVAGIALAIGFSVWNLQRRLGPAVQGLSPEQARVAYRAARRGQIPAQPEVRAAALAVAERQLAGVLRARIGLVIAGVCVVLAEVLLALDGDGIDWWRLLAAAAFAVLIATQFLQPKQLRRRIALLRG